MLGYFVIDCYYVYIGMVALHLPNVLLNADVTYLFSNICFDVLLLYVTLPLLYHFAMGRELDLQSTGRGFKSYLGQKLRNNLGQIVHTYVPLLPSSIT